MFDPAWLTTLLPLPVTILITVIDIRCQTIPDALNLVLLGIGIGLAVATAPTDSATTSCIALVQAGLAYLLLRGLRTAYSQIRGRTGLGLGDVKLAAAGTALVGLAGLPMMVCVASLSGLVAVSMMKLMGRPVNRSTRLPFGPFLALGLHVAAILGFKAS